MLLRAPRCCRATIFATRLIDAAAAALRHIARRDVGNAARALHALARHTLYMIAARWRCRVYDGAPR